MRRFVAKLGFMHRRLWHRDGTYRAAVLLGPPPLLGGAVAALAWAGVHAAPAAHGAAEPLPPWATVSGPRVAASSDAPRAVRPALELPTADAAGMPSGYATGWQGGIQPVEISAALDTGVLTTRLAPLVVDEPSLDLRRIRAAGPATGRFVGVGVAALAIRTAGTYALTLRIERADPEPAACLQRLVFAGQRLVSNYNLGLTGPATLTFEPVSFELQPGLYPIAAVFGCWRDRMESGTGKLSVLIRHPGEQELRPARPDEILRTASQKS